MVDNLDDKKRIILFGSAKTAREIVENLKDVSLVKYIVDNDKQKWGKTIVLSGCQYVIYPPSELLKEDLSNVLLLIASRTVRLISEIKAQISEMLSVSGYGWHELISKYDTSGEYNICILSFFNIKESEVRKKCIVCFDFNLYKKVERLYWKISDTNTCSIHIEGLDYIEDTGSKIIDAVNNQRIVQHNGYWETQSKIVFQCKNPTIKIEKLPSVEKVCIYARVVIEEDCIALKYIDRLMSFSMKASEDFVAKYATHCFSFRKDDVKPIAFYLPQFHAIQENDIWWGKGFTEWTNVTKSYPLFEGHYQPRLPIDLGFYDLTDIKIQQRQIELAKQYGVYGFCFYYYWFNGKRLLEKPLDNFLTHKAELDFPFCLCWANENWTRRWDGLDKEILIAQNHSDKDDLSCINDINKYLQDDRYIKIDGKPLIIIYKANLLPNSKCTAEIWREFCRKAGIGEIHLLCAMTFESLDYKKMGFDGIVEFPPHLLNVKRIELELGLELMIVASGFKGEIFDYSDLVNNKKYFKEKYEDKEILTYKTSFPSWDNTARSGIASIIYHRSSPALFKQWLKDIIIYTKKKHTGKDKFIFINAWNEWAEGAHLEPDRRLGYANLQALSEAIIETR